MSDEDVAGLLKEGRRLLEAFVETRAEMEAEGSGEGKGKKVGRVTMDRKLAPVSFFLLSDSLRFIFLIQLSVVSPC